MTDVVQTRKEQIFDKTLELVAGFGYENVSMRNIGDAVDIKACSIYNHYEKKEHILEDFYDYYTNNFLKRRLSEEEVRRVIREGTIEDIAALLPDGGYTQFEPRETTRMMLLTKIIYTRMYFDPKAGEIYHSTTELAKKNTQKKIGLRHRGRPVRSFRYIFLCAYHRSFI